MSGAADRLPRLLALVPYLRTHQGAELADVASVFGVDVRQLRDDLSLLWVCGLPGGGPGDLIDFAFEGDTVRVIDPQTLDRPLRLTADEALALRVAARALADVPGLAEREALESAQAKLAFASGGVPGDPADPPASVPLQVALEPESHALATVRSALEAGLQLELRYLVPSRDEITERTVDPMRLASVDGRWYLEGWCQGAEAVRLFRLDRMVEVTPGALAPPLPSEAVPRDLAEGLFRPRDDDLTVVLELDPGARWVADYYPVEQATELDISAGGQGPGRLRVELRTPDPAWVVRLALRLGGRGRVVSPDEVVQAVREQAAAALAALSV